MRIRGPRPKRFAAGGASDISGDVGAQGSLGYDVFRQSSTPSDPLNQGAGNLTNTPPPSPSAAPVSPTAPGQSILNSPPPAPTTPLAPGMAPAPGTTPSAGATLPPKAPPPPAFDITSTPPSSAPAAPAGYINVPFGLGTSTIPTPQTALNNWTAYQTSPFETPEALAYSAKVAAAGLPVEMQGPLDVGGGNTMYWSDMTPQQQAIWQYGRESGLGVPSDLATRPGPDEWWNQVGYAKGGPVKQSVPVEQKPDADRQLGLKSSTPMQKGGSMRIHGTKGASTRRFAVGGRNTPARNAAPAPASTPAPATPTQSSVARMRRGFSPGPGGGLSGGMAPGSIGPVPMGGVVNPQAAMTQRMPPAAGVPGSGWAGPGGNPQAAAQGAMSAAMPPPGGGMMAPNAAWGPGAAGIGPMPPGMSISPMANPNPMAALASMQGAPGGGASGITPFTPPPGAMNQALAQMGGAMPPGLAQPGAGGAAPVGMFGAPPPLFAPGAAAPVAAPPGAMPPMAARRPMGLPGRGFAKGGKVRQFNSTDAAAENLPTHPGKEKIAKGGVLRRKPKRVAEPVPTPAPESPSTPPPSGGVPMLAKGGKWIKSAIKKPGALHKQLGVPQGEKIPAGKLAKAAESGGKLGQRARLAKTLKGFAKGGVCKECGKSHGGECRMAKGGISHFDSTKPAPGNLATRKRADKFAQGGAAKERKDFPNTNPPPKKTRYADGGKVRGGGAATKGLHFSGIY